MKLQGHLTDKASLYTSVTLCVGLCFDRLLNWNSLCARTIPTHITFNSLCIWFPHSILSSGLGTLPAASPLINSIKLSLRSYIRGCIRIQLERIKKRAVQATPLTLLVPSSFLPWQTLNSMCIRFPQSILSSVLTVCAFNLHNLSCPLF